MSHLKRALPLLALMLTVPCFAARAATLIVDRLDDAPDASACTAAPNDCSLRGAIAKSEADGADSIVFGVTGTITLSGSALPASNNLSIIGPAGGITIDAARNSEVFESFWSGVLLSNLTLTNATTSAIRNVGDSTSMTVERCTIPGSDPPNGNGIFNNGTLTLKNSTISGHDVDDAGGGIRNQGTLTVIDSTISNNQATGAGGGIVSTGTLTVIGSTITGNTGDQRNERGGGGIANTGILTVRDSIISGNQGSLRGGGIYNLGMTTITGSTITGNDAIIGSGGGIYNEETAAALESIGVPRRPRVLTITNSTISGNSCDRFGGGIYNESVLTLTGSTLAGNTADEKGGGLFTSHSIDDDAVVRNSTISGNTAKHGGGIATETGLTQIESSTITANTADANKGSGVAGNSAVDIGNSIVAGNNGTDLDYLNGFPVKFLSSNYNLVGNGNGTVAFNQSGDQINANPRLGALADNGGPTKTHALLSGSPAIDAGKTDLTTDQRGVARPFGAADDIGAFELGAAPGTTIGLGVSVTPKAPKTNDILTATVFIQTLSGTTLSYAWSVNDVPLPNETTDKLDLSKAGNGDKGDRIRVVVTATRANASGTATNFVDVFNSAPSTQNATGSAEGQRLVIVPVTGSDPDGDPITFKRVGGPRDGTGEFFTESGVTKFRYNSRARFDGDEIIRFVAIDSEGKPSDVGTITITVTDNAPKPNNNPTAESFSVDSFVNTSEVVGLRGSDPDGDPLTFRLVNNARFGNSRIRRDADGKFKLFYNSLNRFYGNDRVTYIAIDDKGRESKPATITINFGNRAPIARDNVIGVTAGQSVSQYLFAPDPDKDELTFALVTMPTRGSAEVKRDAQGNWRVFYTANADYAGPDTLTFIATDARGADSGLGVIRIRVDAPVAPSSSVGALHSGDAPSGGRS